MKKFYILLLLTAFTLNISSQQMHHYQTNFTISLKNFVDTIPIEYENDQIYINVLIQGRKYRFNLDTGSSQGMLYQNSRVPIMENLGGVISHDANNVADTIQAVQIAPFMMGKLNISGYVASIVKSSYPIHDYDGIIGFDLFNKGLSAKIDIKHKIMILSDIKGYFDKEPGYSLKYKLKWFVPYVLVSPFIRHVDQALFDSGAKQLYIMNHTSFLQHAYKSKQVNAQVEGRTTGNFTVATNSIEKPSEVVFLNLDRIKWADYSFNRVHTITTQGNSRIGAQIFNYGNIIISPRKKSITFQPYNHADSVDVSNKQFGVAFIDVNNKPQIALIWQQCDAYKAGMRQGDTVLSINGQAITNYSDFVDYKFEENKNYQFILLDARGFKKSITVKR